MAIRIGIDLGGTKIEGIALAPDGSTLQRIRRPTPRGDYDGTVLALKALVAELEAGAGSDGPATVGVAIPGAVSPATGLIKNANSTWLIGRAFDRDLADALRRPVRLANDANCFALSEAVDGAAAGADSVFGVILGTGTGGGLVFGGRLHEGPNLIAGEWGHLPLPWSEPEDLPPAPCYCGKIGCVETYLSGPGFAGHFERQTARHLSAEDIVSAAAAGDAEAEAALARYERQLAKSLAMVITLVDPAVIVLGGGMSNTERLYSTVPALWGRHAFTDELTTALRRARHGDSSGVRGAAWLWPSEEHAATPGGLSA